MQVPYRAMLPEGAANLLVAVRAAMRNMARCADAGQAVGIAAMILAENVGAQRRKVDDLQGSVTKQEARIR
ncbi:FAD-dependent oxidoreductase [Roseovarius salinarum]|uniref:FAD-dependent oxidoreductase n=1 Tax=Roseovarius salinarum TaxID=1981892 RepID=UPI000C34E9FF|nr:FAD-dependent oxidoreductase [Roseovarius salinarum]